MAGNSLQAVLDRAKTAQPESKPATRATKSKPIEVPPAANIKAQGRAGTKLIGGHFAPEVSAQLRILAAEEGSTVQSLLAEALDDLFVKKGKARIIRV